MSGLEKSTRTSYGTGIRKYFDFTRLHGLVTEAFPPSADILLAFATWMYTLPGRGGKGLTASTIMGYLTAVRSICVDLGFPVTAFYDLRLRRVKRGIKKLRSRKARSRLPITIWLAARLIKSITAQDGMAGTMLTAAICTGIYGLMRAGEMVEKSESGHQGLRRDHVFWDPDRKWVDIRLDNSKTDYFREGVVIRLHANGSSTCPVAKLRAAWDAAVDDSPGAPVFQQANGAPCTYKWLQHSLRMVVDRIGLDKSDYGTHSLRIGGATSLAIAGERPETIKEMGRWKSLSYQLYVRVTADAMRRASSRLGELSTRALQPGFSISGKSTRGWSSMFGGLAIGDATKITADDLGEIAARINGQGGGSARQ
jgi:hypothetical protein